MHEDVSLSFAGSLTSIKYLEDSMLGHGYLNGYLMTVTCFEPYLAYFRFPISLIASARNDYLAYANKIVKCVYLTNYYLLSVMVNSHWLCHFHDAKSIIDDDALQMTYSSSQHSQYY
jgi:hypothetical protein